MCTDAFKILAGTITMKKMSIFFRISVCGGGEEKLM